MDEPRGFMMNDEDLYRAGTTYRAAFFLYAAIDTMGGDPSKKKEYLPRNLTTTVDEERYHIQFDE